ncbi:MAG: peptide chain release factor N(5)-glutamine methyltransferase [Oscillospiraceae bacterium]|jgi:release factor glutamine methyltransferase|nr:peptide chain release factor N(5)-glutamine methyltransferase [Oscillospiraceae bacterium]
MSVAILEAAGLEAPRFDSQCLMENFLKISKAEILAAREISCAEESLERFERAVQKRADGYPLQYILGSWDFFGERFYVGEGVLIPRPETELLAEAARKFLHGRKNAAVADLCSGSGCIAITLAKAFPDAQVYAVELSGAAFAYLEKNIKLHKVQNVRAIRADALDPGTAGRFKNIDCVVANPPYVPSGEIGGLQREVSYEPEEALDGGEDGLVFYRGIAPLWKTCLKSGGRLIFEVGAGQAGDVKNIIKNNSFCDVDIIKDFGGIDRLVRGDV